MPIVMTHAAGKPRRLDLKPPLVFGAHRELGAANVLPQSQWRAVDRRQAFPWIKDQEVYSDCTGNGTSGAAERVNALAGRPHVELSAAFLYAQVNGGRDQGASVTDAVTTLQQMGTCPAAEVPEGHIFKNQIPASAYESAKRFRATDVMRVRTLAEMATAIMMDYVVVFTIYVHPQKPEVIDQNGVLAAYPGQPANHCVHMDGLRQLPSGLWVVDMVQSWGLRFGQDGRCFVTADHTDHQPGTQDAFAIRGMTDDPSDSLNPLPAGD